MAHKPKPAIKVTPSHMDTFGLIVDALERAREHYESSAREIDMYGPHRGQASAAQCRVYAGRIADLLEQCPDEASLIRLLRS